MVEQYAEDVGVIRNNNNRLSFFSNSPKKSRPQKFRQGPSPLKLMIIVAYDSTGGVLVHAVPREKTVNADYYYNFLQTNLRAAIRKKTISSEQYYSAA